MSRAVRHSPLLNLERLPVYRPAHAQGSVFERRAGCLTLLSVHCTFYPGQLVLHVWACGVHLSIGWVERP